MQVSTGATLISQHGHVTLSPRIRWRARQDAARPVARRYLADCSTVCTTRPSMDWKPRTNNHQSKKKKQEPWGMQAERARFLSPGAEYASTLLLYPLYFMTTRWPFLLLLAVRAQPFSDIACYSEQLINSSSTVSLDKAGGSAALLRIIQLRYLRRTSGHTGGITLASLVCGFATQHTDDPRRL